MQEAWEFLHSERQSQILSSIKAVHTSDRGDHGVRNRAQVMEQGTVPTLPGSATFHRGNVQIRQPRIQLFGSLETSVSPVFTAASNKSSQAGVITTNLPMQYDVATIPRHMEASSLKQELERVLVAVVG